MLHQSICFCSSRSFCLLPYQCANLITSCGAQVKPPMQGVQSEAVPVAPNSQSAPAVSPQVCCSPCYDLKSMAATTICRRNTLLHFQNNCPFYERKRLFRMIFHRMRKITYKRFGVLCFNWVSVSRLNFQVPLFHFQLWFFGRFGFLLFSFSGFPLLPSVVLFLVVWSLLPIINSPSGR